MASKIINLRKSRSTELELQFWLRVFALWIDYILLVKILLPLIIKGLAFIIPDMPTNMYNSDLMNTLIGPYGVSLILIWAYFSIMNSSKLQATIGKWFLRFKIVNKNGLRISFFQSVLRFPLKLLAIGTIVGVWMVDLNKNRQALHDLICGTLVIRR